MAYLIFGFAIGTFICGLIEKYHKPDKASWINPKYLFLLSGLIFLLFIYIGWPLLEQVISRI